MSRYAVIFKIHGEHHNTYDTREIQIRLSDYPLHPVIGGTALIPDIEEGVLLRGTITEVEYPAWKPVGRAPQELSCIVHLRQDAFDRLDAFLKDKKHTAQQRLGWSTHGNPPKTMKTA